ncbi:RNA polymerase sigma factor [Streptosporangium sp. KLBMP 9127]|nr:RNA polymerase sigma factor [Streptosporangium sp. KLBMP 9127]
MDDERQTRFEVVYRETYERILGYAVRRCHSPEDAADVVAETYAIAWRRVADLPGGDEARLWLYGVARNVLANHRRGEQRRHARQIALEEDIAVFFPSPEETQELRAIGHVFRSLSVDDRELLSLVAWEGLDAGEIAHVLGRSRNAVRIRIYRARKRLSHALEDAGLGFTRNRTAEIQAGRPS